MATKKTVIVAHCPKCNGDRAADIVGEHSESYNSDNYDENTLHRILKCRGCSHIQFQTATTSSEDVDYSYDDAGETVMEYPETIHYFPPIARRSRPDYTRSHPSYSPAMKHLLDEAYDALKADLPVVASIALRTVFDAATEVLGIDPSLSFKKKLDQLVADSKIDKLQRETLNALTDAGSAAAHRGWKPTNQELDIMFTIMESFLHRAFVTSMEQKELAKRAAALRKRTPKRPTTKSTATGTGTVPVSGSGTSNAPKS
ncbi:MAG: DUF4145 domain-containing protein [Enhydrobacter sp.]|nr:MAG: DUF4145 domain-containing protein [Enhydrobacter sp.]